jgi:peptidoglycan/LPS O-acetylase OafA/YrhL
MICREDNVANVRGIKLMSVAAAVVLIGYVVAELADVDFGSSLTAIRVAVLAGAAIVAVIAFQAWSHGSTVHTGSAMVLGLLGGASIASTVTTAKAGDVYGSQPMALVGTVAVVAAATVAQLAHTRNTQNPRKEDAR